MPDHRDAPTWVAIELTKAGEVYADEGTLEQQLRRDLDLDADHPIFVPCTVYRRDGRSTTIHLMEGYAFIASGVEDVELFALEKNGYVNQVMSSRQGPYRLRTLSVITDAQVRAMRAKLQELISASIPLGAAVEIEDGQYRGLDGKVIGLDDDQAFVRITLRSLDVVATIPRVFLREAPLD